MKIKEKKQKIGNLIADVVQAKNGDLLEDLLRQVEIAQAALEQHHKELMGLVERWRDREAEFWNRKDDYSFGLHQAYGNAADDLEEIINLKD